MTKSCPLCKQALSSDTSNFGDVTAFDCARCGHFEMTNTAFAVLASEWSTRHHMLSAATRRHWEIRRTALRLGMNFDEVAASARIPATNAAKLEQLLLVLVERTPLYGQPSKFDVKFDYPLVGAQDAGVAAAYVRAGTERGWLDPSGQFVTQRGHEKADELRGRAPDSRQVFVAMSFDPSHLYIHEQGIEPGVKATKYYEPTRVDGFEHNGKIDDKIVAEIKRSGIVVADFTGQRRGVYFEAGLALGSGIPVVWTCSKKEIDEGLLHFDTRQYNYIAWTSVDDLRERLTARLIAMPESKMPR